MKAALLPRVRAMLDQRHDPTQSDADLLRAFAQHGDENAFTMLVRRHGRLVFGTARRVVGNADDADDVFQATFFLLAREARTIRNPDAVGGWLHGVASRMAKTARRAAARRRTHEGRVTERQPTNSCELTWNEVQLVFEQELARLPDHCRVPFVLCTLNGESRSDVARRLGIKEGTISSRLAEAKKRLQSRLAAKGISLTAILGTIVLPEFALSATLVARTVSGVSNGEIPAAVSALIQGGIMSAKKAILMIAAAVAATVFIIGQGRSGDVAGGTPQEPVKESRAKPEPEKAPEKTDTLNVRGKLVDANGKPLVNVPLHLWSFRDGNKLPDPIAKTAADGTFQFDAKSQDAIEEARIVAVPPGLPLQWLPLSKFTREQTIQLPQDDVAFTGRITSLENQPLKGVSVEVVRVSNVGDGNLSAWLEKNVSMRKEHYWLNEGGLVSLPGNIVAATNKATTDADGKFKLVGFGRDRVLTVRVTGPQLETKFFWVVTRPNAPKGGYISTDQFNHSVHGNDVSLMLLPSRPLVGTVKDSKTGKPVAGVKVSEVNSHIAWATTDQDGKYRLEGVPKKKHYALTATGAKGIPYFDGGTDWFADVAGLDPLEMNIDVHRGVELIGRVVDKAGRPVRAEVSYSPLDSNPNAAKPGMFGIISSDGWKTKPDGTFYLTAWAGKGVLSVFANDSGKYSVVDGESILSKLGVRSRPVSTANAMLPIDVDESKPESLTFTITLHDGLSRKGQIVDSDGKPASGVFAGGLRGGPLQPLKSSEFTIAGMGATSKRVLVIMDAEKKSGALQTIAGDDNKELTIKLQPLGAAIGEVTTDGKLPSSNLIVTAVPLLPDDQQYENLPYETMKNQGRYAMIKAPFWRLTKRETKTDDKRRFRLEGLVPGLEYTIYVSDGDLGEADTLVTSKSKVKVEWGKVTDVGTLKKE